MERFTEIGQRFIEKIRNQFDNGEQASRKRWFAYGGLLIVSVIIFLTLGGSRSRPPMVMPAGETEMLIGETFREMSDRMVGMGEPDRLGIEWEMVPEGLDPVYQTWGRDPFTVPYPGGTRETISKTARLILSAISWRGSEAIVLINDSVLKKGDYVDGAEVLDIFSDTVILKRGNEQIVLNLSGGG